MDNPENVHLEFHVGGVGFAHQKVEERAIAVRLKFVAMSVIKEGHVMQSRHFPHAVEHLDGMAARRFIERAFVINPGAADIHQTQVPRLEQC